MWGWLRRSEQDFSEEIRANMALDEDRFIAEGMSPDEARSAALRAFGNVTRAQERFYESRRTIWLDNLHRDVRYALRRLIKNPGFTVVVVVTLALGIGANAAIFSVVNSLLLRSLPVTEPQRLVTISSDSAVSRGFNAGAGWNYMMWDQLRQRAGVFDGAFAWTTNRFNLAQSGEIQPADGIYASGDFFTTLGVPALLGRTFTSADDKRGGGPDGPVAVISYGLWQRRFGGAANVIGSPLLVGGVPFTIIGVTPPEFFGVEIGQAFDVALPLSTEPLISGKNAAIDEPRRLFLIVMLRLKPGQSVTAATAAIRAMQPQILSVMGTNLPPFLKEPFAIVPAATGTADRLRQQYERPLLTISLVVALVLLIACVNIANLLLARATARRHEFSVRLAIGASRWRVGQQLLVESVVLAVAGALAGLVVAAWGSRALVGQLSTSVDDRRIVLDLSLDWHMIAFTAAVALATAILFGTVPALHATRVAPINALKENGRSASDGARMSVSSGLVIAQVALSLTLVVAAGLLVRTFAQLANVPLGFDREGVLLINVDTARTRIDPADRNSFYHQLVATAASVPGVAAATGSFYAPAGGGGAGLIRDARGRAVDDGRVVANFITPGWFAAYGIPIRAGRDVTDHDSLNGLPVMIVNDAFVRRFTPRGNAIGETFDESISSVLKNRTVVGVVGDAVYGSLRDAAPPTVYVPLAQSIGLQPPGRTTVIISVRPVAGSAASLAPSVAAALTEKDRDLAFSFRPLADQVSASLTQERLLAMLSGFFGGLALLLAGLGLYGITSYAVNRRRTEIGIRMALGARRADVISLVLRQGIVVTAIGMACGLAGSAAVTRYLEAMLFDLTPLDPTTFIAVSLLFGLVAVLALYVPARRATKVDPMVALRCE
jgi:putative ABC transport system permease protein